MTEQERVAACEAINAQKRRHRVTKKVGAAAVEEAESPDEQFADSKAASDLSVRSNYI